jgi:hypothetical protein
MVKEIILKKTYTNHFSFSIIELTKILNKLGAKIFSYDFSLKGKFG